MSLNSHSKDRARLALAAIVVAICTIAAVVLVPDHYFDDIPAKWDRFTLVTVGWLGLSLKAYWRVRKSGVFWFIFVGFFLAHVIAIGGLFYSGQGLPLFIFGPICALELAAMALVIYWKLGVGPGSVRVDI